MLEIQGTSKKRNLNKLIYLTLNNFSISRAGAWTYSVAWIRDNDHHEVLEVRLLDIEYSLFFGNLFEDMGKNV